MREGTAGRALPLWIGLKFFSVFGPNEYQRADMMSLVAKNYPRISAGEPIRLFKSHRPDYADGEQCRDFIYVKDCAAVMLWLLRSATNSGIFNVGTGQARNFRQLMEAVGLACGVPPIIEYVETPPAIRSGYQYFTEAVVGKLRAAGYTASFTPLETAVSDFVTEYLAKDPYL